VFIIASNIFLLNPIFDQFGGISMYKLNSTIHKVVLPIEDELREMVDKQRLGADFGGH